MLFGMEDRMPYTIESLLEIYRDGRPLMAQEYVTNAKNGRRAKIIIVSAGLIGYEGIVAYDGNGTMHMAGPNVKRLMAAMKREVKVQLKK